ncbi:MAG: cytochrome c [Pseudomonadota bacterium]
MSPFKQFFVHAAVTLALMGAIGSLGAALVVYFGLYNMAAVDQHTKPVYTILDTALRQSIRQRAKHIATPPLSDKSLVETGFVRFRSKCVPCHGAPGVPPGDAGKGMLPLPTNLVETARGLTSAEIFWVIKNGIKMTGMPAWQFRFKDDEIWTIVAFVKELPKLSPRDYRAMERKFVEATIESTPTEAAR